MNKNQFESRMNHSITLKLVDQKHEDYYTGYQRGLRKAYHDNYGTDEQHELWYNISENEVDITRYLRGMGYRDGYDGKPPQLWR